MKHCDALIIGAGPAGSLLALRLARLGFAVILLDKARFPRPKVCGDSLNPRCREIFQALDLGAAFDRLPQTPIRGVVLESAAGRFQWDAGEAMGHCAVERTVLDHWLLQEAKAAGAEVWEETTLQQFTLEGAAETSQGGVHAQIVVGADGRNSQVARHAGLLGPARRCHRVGWQANIPATWVTDERVHLQFFSEGYYGLVKINATQADFCLVLDGRRKIIGAEVVRRFFPGLGEVAWRKIAPIERAAAGLGRERVWLVGDASRVVEPVTGEGLYFALAGAEQAAEALMPALRAGNFSGALRSYQAGHQALYRRRGRINQLAQWLLRKPQRAQRAVAFFPRFPALGRYLIERVQGRPADFSNDRKGGMKR